MSIVILNCSADNEYADSCIDYAAVWLEPDLIACVKKRMALLRALHELDEHLYEMYYWDFHPQFFSYSDFLVGKDGGLVLVDKEPELASAQRLIDLFLDQCDMPNAEWAALPADHGGALETVLEHSTCRTECTQMVVRANDIMWTTIPKDGSGYVRTASLAEAQLCEMEEERKTAPLEEGADGKNVTTGNFVEPSTPMG